MISLPAHRFIANQGGVVAARWSVNSSVIIRALILRASAFGIWSMSGSEGSLPFVRLFTDGACKGNPGPGGWGCILRHPASDNEKEFSGGEANTTNNQMELQAVIEGLQRLTRRSKVDIVTDSKYVADGCRSWVEGWKRNGWRRKQGRKFLPVKNVELWKQLDALLSRHEVVFTVVKGHSGHPENERCDELAVAAAEKIRHHA